LPPFFSAFRVIRTASRIGTVVDAMAAWAMAQEALMQNRHATAMTRFSMMTALGLGALAAGGCSSGTPVGASPATSLSAAAASGATPIAVNCGPGQQALIRPSLIAGQTISQVECVPVAAAVPGAVGYPGVAAPMPGVPVGSMPGTAAAMPAYAPAPQIMEQPVVYQPAPRRVYRTATAPRVVRQKSGRSWQKSAVIIGSSAGVGAGVGGAVKGKKGALIGAAIGGGVATIWDQATRKR
jgi:hypothetical protein